MHHQCQDFGPSYRTRVHLHRLDGVILNLRNDKKPVATRDDIDRFVSLRQFLPVVRAGTSGGLNPIERRRFSSTFVGSNLRRFHREQENDRRSTKMSGPEPASAARIPAPEIDEFGDLAAVQAVNQHVHPFAEFAFHLFVKERED